LVVVVVGVGVVQGYAGVLLLGLSLLMMLLGVVLIVEFDYLGVGDCQWRGVLLLFV
jgi:hypothetical protein